MKLLYRIFFFTSLFNLLSDLSIAQTADSVKIYLWPDGVPFALGTAEEDKPSITIYFPTKEKSSGAGVLVIPGGGYVSLALGHEGWQVAKWYNSIGVTAAILRYRLCTYEQKKYRHPIPFLDATRAMRLFRSKAASYGINPEKIGVIGFSAGGHLASLISTNYDGGNLKSKDPIEKFSSKVNFSCLIYPVITFRNKYSFKFGRKVLLGDNADPKLIDSVSTETRVSTLTPPTFLLSTADDDIYCENSIGYFLALREHKIDAEMHIYERGGHGYGLYPAEQMNWGNPERLADWPERMKNFLRNRGGIVKD